jgi:hypothetical protein
MPDISPYMSSLFYAAKAAAQANYTALSARFSDVNPPVFSPEDTLKADLERIRENNKVGAAKVNQEKLPAIAWSIGDVDYIIHNKPVQDKFNALNGATNNKIVKYRAVTVSISNRVYASNYLQALLLQEHVLVEYNTAYRYQYTNPHLAADNPALVLEGQVTSASPPKITKVSNLEDNGAVYRLDYDVRATAMITTVNSNSKLVLLATMNVYDDTYAATLIKTLSEN